MTTQPAATIGDAPPRHLLTGWRRRQILEAATHRTRQASPASRKLAAMRETAAAADLVRGAVARAIKRGDWRAHAYVVAALTHLATDIDRRQS
jgi:hypothetical protein